MTRIIKVFLDDDERAALGRTYRRIADYEGFGLFEVPQEDLAALARTTPFEDLTPLYEIQLDDRTIDTSRPRIDRNGKQQPHPAYRGAKALSAGPHHYLVQFVGPILPAWLRAVKRAGGDVRAPFSDFTMIVLAATPALKRIAALPQVRWIGHLPPRARIDPNVMARAARKPTDAAGALPRTRVMPGLYKIEMFGPKELAAALPAIKRLGFDVRDKSTSACVIVVAAPSGAAARRQAIDALAAVHGVKSIRERTVARTSNDVAARVMDTARSLAAPPGLGLSGRGEIIGICDTGLDTGDPSSLHPDFAGRIAAIKSYPISPDFAAAIDNPGADDGPADLNSGHGTHVAGSALGDGRASAALPGLAGPIRGLAYEAKLVFQAVEQALDWKDPANNARYGRYLLAGLPLDIGTLFDDAYRNGVRVHSNSWGGGAPGAYENHCEQVDRFVWQHKDFCILFAAGNDGNDRGGTGKIQPMSVTAPGTAKNCITVGASENLRPNFNQHTYGAWWPNDYPVAPFKNDPLADDPDEVAAFSSRGPTQDGRTKPDIVAPGTFILSTRSTMIATNNQGWSAFPPSKLYFYLGGTSMATPLTAGAVAIVRQYLRTQRAIARPSAALLKAMLVAGAHRVNRAAVGIVHDVDQGYGRIDLDAILAPEAPASVAVFDIVKGLGTGAIAHHPIIVRTAAVALRIVLAYTDYPGANLVNNLNLLVRAPDGTRYAGNAAAGSTAVDVNNNVEAVVVASPAAGAWTIEIVGSNVPQGPQDYALVVRGDLG